MTLPVRADSVFSTNVLQATILNVGGSHFSELVKCWMATEGLTGKHAYCGSRLNQKGE